MLEIIEERRNADRRLVAPFLEATLAHPFPGPSDRFTVLIAESQHHDTLPTEYSLQRPDDTQLTQHHVDYSDLFQIFDDTKIIKIFASLLFERRILFISSNLGRLSSVIHAAASLLTPFAWQHVFIPILPARLIDYVLAPMPFVVGVHSSMTNTISKQSSSMEEVVYVNIDQGLVLTHAKDHKLLPDQYLTRLRSSIRKFYPQKTDVALFSPLEDAGVASPGASAVKRRFDQQTNSEISDVFLNFLSSIFGKYDQFFDPSHKFLFAEFKASQPKNVQGFLEEFQVVQMYEQFIQERAKRRALGLDIGFQTVVHNSSNLQKLVLSSRDVGKKMKLKAGKTFETVLASSKSLTQKMKSGLEPAFKPEALKFFTSSTKSGLETSPNPSSSTWSDQASVMTRASDRTSKLSLDDAERVGSQSPPNLPHPRPPRDPPAGHHEAENAILRNARLAHSKSNPDLTSPGDEEDLLLARRNSDPHVSQLLANMEDLPPLPPRKTSEPARPSSVMDVPTSAPPRQRMMAASFTTPGQSSSSSSPPTAVPPTKLAGKSSFFSSPFKHNGTATFSTSNSPSSGATKKSSGAFFTVSGSGGK